MERTGIRERRIAADSQALSDLSLPAARQALEQAGSDGTDIDLLIVATVTPDMMFPSTVGDPRRPAGREGRGRVRPLRRLHRLHVRARAGLRDGGVGPHAARARGRRRRALPHPRLDRPLDGRPVRRRRRRGRARAFGGGGLPRLRARRRRRRRRAPLAAGQRLAPLRGSGPAREDERARGVQVRDACSRVVCRGRAASDAGRVSRTSTSTSRIRRTFVSSITQPRSSGSRPIGWWSMSTVTATRLPARSRSRSPMRRRTEGFGRVASYS